MLEDLKRNDGKNVIKSKIGCRLLFAEMFLTSPQYEALRIMLVEPYHYVP